MVVRRCSTSRKNTFALAITIARPLTSATSGSTSGTAAQNVVRVSGRKIRFSGRITANIAVNVTKFVATIESGRSWRGKRTCFIRLPAPTRLTLEFWSEAWKKTHGSSPVSTKSGKYSMPSARRSTEKTSV